MGRTVPIQLIGRRFEFIEPVRGLLLISALILYSALSARFITLDNKSIFLRFTGLEPFTNYNVTFYIQDSKYNKIYPSTKYVNTTTGEGGKK